MANGIPQTAKEILTQQLVSTNMYIDRCNAEIEDFQKEIDLRKASLLESENRVASINDALSKI